MDNMPTIRKVLAGRKAKSRGSQFESTLCESAKATGWHCIHIKSGHEGWGPNMRPQRQDFDFVFLKKGVAIFADAKTTLHKSYARSDITPHQLESLLKCEAEEFTAGYIVGFTELNLTKFFSARLLSNLKPRESLGADDGVSIGTNTFIDLDMIPVWQTV